MSQVPSPPSPLLPVTLEDTCSKQRSSKMKKVCLSHIRCYMSENKYICYGPRILDLPNVAASIN